MRARIASVLVALCVLFMAPGSSSAAWDKDDVEKIRKKIEEGKGFTEGGAVDSDQVQAVGLQVEPGVTYWIDFKTHRCYLLMRQGVTAASCRDLKKGYPLFAPLITWDKDGWAEN